MQGSVAVLDPEGDLVVVLERPITNTLAAGVILQPSSGREDTIQ